MSGERKELVMFDQVVASGAGVIRGDIQHVDGGLVSIDIKNDPLGAAGAIDITGGPGKAEVNQALVGEDSTGLVPLAALTAVLTLVRAYRSVVPHKYIQVAVTQGATTGRVRVTAIVDVDQR